MSHVDSMISKLLLATRPSVLYHHIIIINSPERLTTGSWANFLSVHCR